jgi:aryl-alcohol dehydrogenase-like predicted oxidoreductase
VGAGRLALGRQRRQDVDRRPPRGIDAGINFIDTAPAYGFGHGEEVVGKAIEGGATRS